MSPIRIFGWEADSGTGYWRLRLPLGELANRGHDVMVDARMPDIVMHDAEADVVVAGRTAMPAPSAVWQRLCREERMLCVYELDDDFWSVEADNKGAYDLFARQQHKVTVQVGLREYAQDHVTVRTRENIEANLACAHLVTVSTPTLAEVVSRYTTAPIVVLPNRVPRWLTERPAPWERERQRLVAGHTGGPSHIRDFGECAKPLRAWLQRYGDRAEFHALGYDSTPRVASIRGRTRHTGWTPNVDAYLRAIDFDIGLTPLRDTIFARSKSALKIYEFMSLGMPVIASPVVPYAVEHAAGAPVLLAKNARDWARHLEDLFRDGDLRRELGERGREYMRKSTIEDQAHLWEEVYRSSLSGARANQRSMPAVPRKEIQRTMLGR